MPDKPKSPTTVRISGKANATLERYCRIKGVSKIQAFDELTASIFEPESIDPDHRTMIATAVERARLGIGRAGKRRLFAFDGSEKDEHRPHHEVTT